MQSNEWFRLWFSSPYYDLLYQNRNNEEAVLLIDKLTPYLQIPAHSFILDAACGKGRHSIALAAKGFDVTGIDICPIAIAEAKKSENNNLHFFVHDLRLPFYINYFNFAFNFFTSFGYFRTMREHNDALRTIAQSLKPNGVFVLDYLNAYVAEQNLQPTESKEINNVKFDIERSTDDQYFYKNIHIEDVAANVSETFTERVEKFSLDDLKIMLSRQGLQTEHVFGNYDLSDYDEKKSQRMIIVSRKMQSLISSVPL